MRRALSLRRLVDNVKGRKGRKVRFNQVKVRRSRANQVKAGGRIRTRFSERFRVFAV